MNTLKSKLEQAERRILVLKSECQDKELGRIFALVMFRACSFDHSAVVKAAEEVIQTAEQGVQCEIPRTSLEWKSNNVANSNMLRVNSDAPSSLDSPVIQHLLVGQFSSWHGCCKVCLQDCWASATGNFSTEDDGMWKEILFAVIE